MKTAYYIGWVMRGLLIGAGIYLSTVAILDMFGPTMSLMIALGASLYFAIATMLLLLGEIP